jgi:hypothetical protein
MLPEYYKIIKRWNCPKMRLYFTCEAQIFIGGTIVLPENVLVAQNV